MTDRTVLADALQGATVEMLREDARVLAGWADEFGGADANTPMLRRLAALALAVAEMQERRLDVSFSEPRFGEWVDIMDRSLDDTAQGDTLPAALAALLKGGA